MYVPRQGPASDARLCYTVPIMLLEMLYAKLHGLTVTRAELHYEGSAGIDADRLAAVGLLPGQKVDILNVCNGERFSTYVIAEPAGSGTTAIYGAAARKVQIGDTLIVIAYVGMTPEEAAAFTPKVLHFT